MTMTTDAVAAALSQQRRRTKLMDDASHLREQWDSLDRAGKMARHPDLTFQVMCHQISADYTTFFKRHVRPLVRRRMSGIAPKLNLREHSLMLALSQIPSGQSGVDLAFLIRTDPATVSRNIASLRRKGLVEAESDPMDSRAHVYTLTQDGFTLDGAFRAHWREAIAQADTVIGAITEMEFRDRLATFYSLKDRAQAHARWTPGDRNVFRRGMGRPTAKVRPDIDAVRLDSDSFFRFFGQQVSADYLVAIDEHLAAPVLATADGDLSLTHLRTLMCLDFHDAPLSGADIARALRFDPATVARATDALEATGYIATRVHARDRRRLENVLTPAGSALVRNYRRAADEMEADVDADYGLSWDASARRKALAHMVKARERAGRLAGLRRLPS